MSSVALISYNVRDVALQPQCIMPLLSESNNYFASFQNDARCLKMSTEYRGMAGVTVNKVLERMKEKNITTEPNAKQYEI